MGRGVRKSARRGRRRWRRRRSRFGRRRDHLRRVFRARRGGRAPRVLLPRREGGDAGRERVHGPVARRREGQRAFRALRPVRRQRGARDPRDDTRRAPRGPKNKKTTAKTAISRVARDAPVRRSFAAAHRPGVRAGRSGRPRAVPVLRQGGARRGLPPRGEAAKRLAVRRAVRDLPQAVRRGDGETRRKKKKKRR